MARVAFVYGGPGAALGEIGRDLYNKVLPVRHALDRADKAMASEGFKATKACFLGTPEAMARPSVAGPAIFALSQGITDALIGRKIFPEMVCGHGWGELVALGCMGAIPFEDGLRFLKKRGEILESAWADDPFDVASVSGISVSELARILEPLPKPPLIVAENSPEDCVLAGEPGILDKILPLLAARHAKLGPLTPGYAWPHPSLARAGERVAVEFSALKVERKGSWEAYSCSPAGRIVDFQLFVSRQADLCVKPIDFRGAIGVMRAEKMDTVVEIGPGSFLGAAARRLDNGIRALASEDAKALAFSLKLAI